MKRMLVLGGVLLCAVSVARAAEQSSLPPSDPSDQPRAQAVAPITLDDDVVTAMQAEIDARIEQGRKAANALNEKMLAATGGELQALLKQNEELNEAIYLDILRIQSRHTRAAGLTAAADRIDAVIAARIEAREHPESRVPVQKRERPRPDATGGQR